jgi:sugar (pentulose or hexulose) kinase
MPAQPVIAILDVGKTNKKLLLFNEQYEVVHEQTARFAEITDEDGFPCENLDSLRASVHDSLRLVFRKRAFAIKAINVAAYGASLVYIDERGEPVAPLYNYLKPYPDALQQRLHAAYGGREAFAVSTASPVLGSLNSGLQLYRIKAESPERFQNIKYALHLPQYVSYLITGQAHSDITSIGCHTALWDFEKDAYHQWVEKEGLLPKLAPVRATDDAIPAVYLNQPCAVGVGVHDSSAALIPYMVHFQEPFVLISTGTWCISLNPFNTEPLTAAELAQDCLSYLNYKGQPVKAARFFAGPVYEEGVKRICEHFGQSSGQYRNVPFDATIVAALKGKAAAWGTEKVAFNDRDLNAFANDTEAYHQLMLELMAQQYASTRLVLKDQGVKRIFVDGGFSKNAVYMNLLAAHFPEQEVYAASMAQGTALGAALAIHSAWNRAGVPTHIVDLKYYALPHTATI